jgi:SAM-dependent methyltransferase
MTQTLVFDGPAVDPGTLQLIPATCPLCGADEGEPVAVGNDFAHGTTGDSFLVLSCHGCGLLYLNPRPAPEEWHRLYPPGYFNRPDCGHGGISRTAIRELLRACGAISPGARVLTVGYGPTLHLGELRRAGSGSWALEALTPHESLARAAEQAGLAVHRGRPDTLEAEGASYDLILLLHALENCDAPLEEVRAIRGLLRDGGRLVIMTPNAASAAWRLFQGRHWAGYDFPRHRCLFSPETLRRLAADAGFAVDRVGSLGDGRVWAASAGYFARDWSAPAWLTRAATAAFGVLGTVEAMASGTWSPRAGCPQLAAVLRNPAEMAR